MAEPTDTCYTDTYYEDIRDIINGSGDDDEDDGIRETPDRKIVNIELANDKELEDAGLLDVEIERNMTKARLELVIPSKVDLDKLSNDTTDVNKNVATFNQLLISLSEKISYLTETLAAPSYNIDPFFIRKSDEIYKEMNNVLGKFRVLKTSINVTVGKYKEMIQPSSEPVMSGQRRPAFR